MEVPPVRVGTSSWSSADWRGKIYPQAARPGDFLEQYARCFDTVECDATFYGVPAATTVDGWRGAAGRRDSEWGELALDRTAEMREWVAPLRAESIAGARVPVYFNNHYAGYAPGSAMEFRRLWLQA